MNSINDLGADVLVKTNQATDTGMAMCAFNNRLYVVFKASGKDALLIMSSSDGVTWSDNTKLNQATDTGIAMCAFNNKLYVVFKASGKDALLIMSSSDGVTWSDNVVTRQATSERMAICTLNGNFYIAFKSSNDDKLLCLNLVNETAQQSNTLNNITDVGMDFLVNTNEFTRESTAMCAFNGKLHLTFKFRSSDDLFVVSSSDGMTWSKNGSTRQYTNQGMAMCVFNNKLYIAFKSNNSDELFVINSSDGVNWSSNVSTKQYTKESMAICVFNNKLYIAFKSSNSDDLFVINSSDGVHWSTNVSTRQATNQGMAMCAFNNKLYIAFKSSNSDDLFVTNSSDGVIWSSNVSTRQATKEGMAISTFNNKLYITFKSSTDDGLLMISSSDGMTWSKNVNTGQATRQGITTSVFNSNFYIAFKSSTDDKLLCLNLVKENNIDLANWMARLPDSLTLNSIVMPGSHDAGMSITNDCFPPGTGKFSKTQSLSIYDQLRTGVRYFDIRVDYDDELKTYHKEKKTVPVIGADKWVGCNGQNLSDVFEQAKKFLGECNKETFIFKISHIKEDSVDTKSKINSFLNNYSAFIYKHPNRNYNLTQADLKSLRGKMILVFDYDDFIDPTTGRFRYSDYGANINSNNLRVYDDYSNKDDFDAMKSDQIDKWNKYGKFNTDYLFLLSWTLSLQYDFSPAIFGTLTSSVEDLANKANKWLPVELATRGRQKPNIVYVDFIDSKLAQFIVKLNF